MELIKKRSKEEVETILRFLDDYDLNISPEYFIIDRKIPEDLK